MGDWLRQIGVSWSCVCFALRQMRQRHMTREPCRVKDSLRHADKSLLSFPSGDVLSALHNRQLLSFTVTRVSRTHGILHHTVIVCQLIISSAAVPSVSHSFGCSIQTRQSIHLTVTPNLFAFCSDGSLLLCFQQEVKGTLYR